MAVVDVTVVPIGTGTTSLSPFVAACQRELQQHGEGLKYELTAMGTIIEGDLDLILAVIRRLHEVPFNHGAKRVSTVIRIDDRRNKTGSITQKIKSVEARLKGEG
jgi:uncharacterized protein (TIGR00106 family)